MSSRQEVIVLDRDKFRGIVEDHLVPLFSGANLLPDYGISTDRRPVVRKPDPCLFELKPDKSDNYCVHLRRSQPFAKASSPSITEYRVAKAFADVVQEVQGAVGNTYEQDVMARFKRRVVAKAVCDNTAHEPAVLSAIDHLDELATRMYEGQAIAASFGFEDTEPDNPLELSRVWNEDFCIVTSNGVDTLLVVDFAGNVLRYDPLAIPEIAPRYAPHRVAPIATWTQEQAGRLALVLNRIGEILVLKDGQLRFARRSGRWHYLTHKPVITQMKCPHDREVRKAVYSSCLDASFARTGACVGIMASGDLKYLKDIAPRPDDHVADPNSAKAKFFRNIIRGQKFQSLDRRLRLELLSIDGATIVSHTGDVLAVGAILQIPGGSSGGGRLAAAIALSEYGTGIKVSQDGGIRGYHRSEDQDGAIPAFLVM